MKISKLQSITAHRPWDMPQESWQFYQEWNKVIFLHWQVEYDALRKLVPEELEIDLFNGKAWLSVVAFTMEKVRPRSLPAVKLISDFHEVNIRTYVKANNKSGVYFLSIEGGKTFSCTLAKAISGLPYRFSKISRTENAYQSSNLQYGDKLEIKYKVGDVVELKTELDRWLTERYALFQDAGGYINEFEIHHIEWPIQSLDIQSLQVDYQRFNALLYGPPVLAHYSNGVQVLAWDKTKICKHKVSKLS